MSLDSNDDFSHFSRSAARESPPADGGRSVAVAEAPAPSPELVVAEPEGAPASCLIAGPVNSGKSAFLSVVWDACAGTLDNDLVLKAVPEQDLADLIEARHRKRRARAGLDASTHNKEYRFHVSAERLGGQRRETIESLGLRQFVCVDGPGGALFHSDLDTGMPLDMQAHRASLIASGRDAESIVFFLKVTDSETRHLVAGNLARLLADLSVPMSVPANPARTPSWSTGPLGYLRQRFRIASEAPASPVSSSTIRVRKLRAERVLIVLNFVDQLCVHWQQQWIADRDPRGGLTPLEIASEQAQPIEIAFNLLGPMFFRQLDSFMRRDAKVAVALCSCGGFDTTSGDPCLDAGGHPNLSRSLDPTSRDQYAKYLGVRETILYAGFGVPTPGVVEELTQERLYREG